MRIGVPQERGHGIQQVFPLVGQPWGLGQIFEWLVGDGNQPLSDTELGKGEEGREVWICPWTRDCQQH